MFAVSDCAGVGGVYSSDPSPFYGRRVGHFPIGVVGPFAVMVFEQRVGIAIAVALSDFCFREEVAEASDKRGGEAAHEGIVVPFQERGVGHYSLHRYASPACGRVIGHCQSARGVAAECDICYAVAAHLIDGRIDIGEVFTLVAHVEGVLPGEAAAAIAAQVNGIECIAGVYELSSPVGLKEVVVESVDV